MPLMRFSLLLLFTKSIQLLIVSMKKDIFLSIGNINLSLFAFSLNFFNLFIVRFSIIDISSKKGNGTSIEITIPIETKQLIEEPV